MNAVGCLATSALQTLCEVPSQGTGPLDRSRKWQSRRKQGEESLNDGHLPRWVLDGGLLSCQLHFEVCWVLSSNWNRMNDLWCERLYVGVVAPFSLLIRLSYAPGDGIAVEELGGCRWNFPCLVNCWRVTPQISASSEAMEHAKILHYLQKPSLPPALAESVVPSVLCNVDDGSCSELLLLSSRWIFAGLQMLMCHGHNVREACIRSPSLP